MTADTGETLACLSIRQPWASLVAAGMKPIENRAWYCSYKGRLLIHAGKTWGRDEQDAYDELMQIAIDMRDRRRQEVLDHAKNFRGGLVGVCTMRGCLVAKEWFKGGGLPYDGRHQWFVGPYGFIVVGARHFPHVVPYKGQQGLFRVPRRVVADFLR